MRSLLGFLLLLLALPAAAAAPAESTVVVTRSGKQWTADYRLSAKAPVWVFRKSILPRESKISWRKGTVKVLTPGIRLQRLGDYDALVSVSGRPLPRRVRLTFTPYFKDIEAGYDPALGFSDGSVALYSDQFLISPMPSVKAASEAPKNEDELPGGDVPTMVTLKDASGPVLAFGERQSEITLAGGGTYVLFGKLKPEIGPAMTTIIDPALPRWLADSLNADMPRLVGHYRDRLGPSPVGQPTLLVSWAGPTKGLVSMGGSVLPGMVVMALEGEGIAKPNDRARQYARSFIAHEAAHFWLGQSVHYSTPAESWITEGGAELLSFRATRATDPNYDMAKRLTEAREECVPFLANGGIADAYRRSGDFRAYYACGAIIALAAAKASGGDFESFVKALIARARPDGSVTRDIWLDLLDEHSRDPALRAAIEDLLDKPHADGKAALDGFIAQAGIGGDFAPPTAK